MSILFFNAFEYLDKFKAAGMSDEQARVLTEAINAQSENLHKVIREYDESRRKELATKADLDERTLELKKEIQEVRLEIEKVRAEMKDGENRLLKWQIGIAVTILVVIAKGFNWLGF